jgi:protein O-mannosyl-transferase
MRTDRSVWILGLVLLTTLISYWPVLHNGSFVWDDEGYITNNPLVQSFQFKEIWSANVMGNFHPLTVLVLAIEYFFFGMNATCYHIFHLLLHLLNVLLVYTLVVQLSRKKDAALVAALLFGIHPMHVESVAWLSELKDLLYAAFFIGSWILYLKYLDDSKRKRYFIALFLFLLSLLSKPAAVVLPVILLLTDFYQGRKLTKSIWIEKIPFFILSFIFGILTLSTQKTSGNLPGLDFTVLQQLTLACFGFISYLVKILFPFQLSAFYPYPVSNQGAFSVFWYVYPVILFTAAICVFYSLRKTKLIFFATVFFTITLFLVLQWMPVGKAIMADRYSYIPSIAVFFLAGEGFHHLWTKKLKWLSILILIVFMLFFSVKTFSRCSVWKNEITLWDDVLSHFNNVPLAWLNRGIAYAKINELDKAIDDISKAIQLDSDYSKADRNLAKAYYNRGNMYMNNRELNKAVYDFGKSIEINPENPRVYYNRGNVFSDLQEYEKALTDYSKAIELDPSDAKPYINRGMVYGSLKQFDKALNDFEKAEKVSPNSEETLFNRGLLYMNMGNYENAIQTFSKFLQLNPQDGEALYHRGYLLFLVKKYPEAIVDFSEVIQMNPDDPRCLFYRGLARYYSSEQQAAEQDLKQAAEMGYSPAQDFIRALSVSK